jgi:hypothetical protein
LRVQRCGGRAFEVALAPRQEYRQLEARFRVVGSSPPAFSSSHS